MVKVCANERCSLPFKADDKRRKYCSRECYKFCVRRFDQIPYPQIWWKGKKEYLHRVIYMMAHNVVLSDKDIIHHKDENPFNRSIENLEKLDGRDAHLHVHNYHRKRKSSGGYDAEFGW